MNDLSRLMAAVGKAEAKLAELETRMKEVERRTSSAAPYVSTSVSGGGYPYAPMARIADGH